MADTGSEDIQAMADEFQQALGSTGFDPFAMIAGTRRFHACFLAPITAVLRADMDRFLEDGGGPLAETVAYFRQQGLGAIEAAARLREIIAHAQGMFVVVLRDDQHLFPIPQFFFGSFDEAYAAHAVEVCAGECDDRDAILAATHALRHRVERGAEGPGLFADAAGTEDPAAFWETFGETLLESVEEGILPGIRQRQADLAHWTARALEHLVDAGEDGDGLLMIARCRSLAGDVAEAIAATDTLLDAFEPVDEELLKLLEELVATAIRKGDPAGAVAIFERHRETIEDVLDGLYECAAAEFRACAAAQVEPGRLVAAAERMRRGDKRSFRHDLNREPFWEVTVPDPGPCLEVDEAAETLDRSANFVSKRLEAGTIPFVRTDDGVAIPERGLAAWRAVMETFKIFD